MNPIMQKLNQKSQLTQNNPLQMLQQFQQFAKGMTPEQAQNMILQKMNSGEISKEQFEDAMKKAKQFSNMFGIK